MLEVVTEVNGQRVQGLQDGNQHQGKRQGSQLPRVQLVANCFEEFQLRGATVQAGIRQACRKVQQPTFGEQLTAERAADVDDAVETVADLLDVTLTMLRPDVVVQLKKVNIVETKRSLLLEHAAA